MSSESARVICMGDILMDLVAKERNRHLQDVTGWTSAAGGAPANVAVGLQRLGHNVKAVFVGCVGSDFFGNHLRQTLVNAGVDITHLATTTRDHNNNTTLSFVSCWDDGHKETCFYRGADCFIPQIKRDVFQDAACFHCGSITLIDNPGATAQRQALQMARECGLLITYDPNYRPTLWPDESTARRVIQQVFSFAHLVKISDEELESVTGAKDVHDGIQDILAQGVVELVIVSQGEKGAVAATKNVFVKSPALIVNVVETTGAGDAFMAAIITKLLPFFSNHEGSLKNVNEETLRDALNYANVVGGLACTRPGAIPALPTARDVQHFLQKQQQQQTDDTIISCSTTNDLAKMIDHTFLKPYCQDTEQDDIEQVCKEARTCGFAAVAVNPVHVQRCCQLLKSSGVAVCAAVAFPLGQMTCQVKAFEIRNAIEDGATEIDMVMNVRALQEGDYELVTAEIESLVNICHADEANRIICKVILETCYLSEEQKIKACEICRDAGVDFVKTSTGWGPAGATEDDVKLMRKTVGQQMGVKASGGIRDLSRAHAMIAAGATRIGTSSGVAIMEELRKEENAVACEAR